MFVSELVNVNLIKTKFHRDEVATLLEDDSVDGKFETT